MYSAVRSMKFQEAKAELPVVIGRTIQNENYVFDLAKMPHLLVAGATGQGKSVGLNAIITSLLYKKHPAQLKFVRIDPKMGRSFALYAKIERHFLAKMESEEEAIITDPAQGGLYAQLALHRNGEPVVAVQGRRCAQHQGVQREVHRAAAPIPSKDTATCPTS